MFKKVLPGLTFTIIWATGSIAAKVGMRSADPLILASIRFICTGLIFGPFYLVHSNHTFWPKKGEWQSIVIYGLLNTALTLGTFFESQKYVSAGITTLFIAIGPLLMALFSSWLLKRRLTLFEVLGMLIAFSGLIICASSAIPGGHATPFGIVLLIIYISAYAFSSVYFSSVKTSLSNAVFNVWQVFIGGLVLLPICWMLGENEVYSFDINFFAALVWMILILSFIANQLWLYLVKIDTVKAAAWLYLTPIFGYLLGYLFFGETITILTIAGTILVIAGLVLAGRSKIRGMENPARE